jgi:hypothetical protein
MEKNTLFEALYYLKDQGYDYVSSQNNDSYVGYDQAVQDFYEGYGDHVPSYLDWLKETVAPADDKIDDYIFCHNGSIFYGNISKSEINSDVTFADFTSDTEIKNRIGAIEELIDGEIDYADVFAIAIWNLGLDKENDRIMNLLYNINTYLYYTKGNDTIALEMKSNITCFTNMQSELYSLLFVDSQCWSDTEFILGVSQIISDTKTLKYFCDSINPSLKTAEFVTEILKVNPKMAAFLPAELNVNSEVALNSIIEDANNFNSISKKLSEDPQFIKEAWTKNHKIYPFLPELMKEDYDIAYGSLEKEATIYFSMPESLKKDKRLVKIAMKNNDFSALPKIFNALPESMRRDENFIREMMSDSIQCYQFLDEDLRNKLDLFQLELTNERSSCYQFIPTKLKNIIIEDSKTLQTVLLSESGASFSHFFEKPHVCSDRALIIQLLELGVKISIYNISEEFHTDEELLLKLVKNEGGEIRRLAEDLQNKEKFILAAISGWEYYYEKLPPKHRKNKKIAVAAINKWFEGGRHKSKYSIDEISKAIPKALLEDTEIQELLKPV